MPADRKWSTKTRQEIVKRYTKGEKLGTISASTGVPESTIFHILKAEGVAPQRMTRRKTAPTNADGQATTLEWFVHRLFEMEAEIHRLRELLSEYGIDAESGELVTN